MSSSFYTIEDHETGTSFSIPTEDAERVLLLSKFTYQGYDTKTKAISFKSPPSMTCNELHHLVMLTTGRDLPKSQYKELYANYTKGVEIKEKNEEETLPSPKIASFSYTNTSASNMISLVASGIQPTNMHAVKSGYGYQEDKNSCNRYCGMARDPVFTTSDHPFHSPIEFTIRRSFDILDGIVMKFVLPSLPNDYLWVDNLEERLIKSISLTMGGNIHIDELDGKSNRMLAHINHLWPKYHNRYTGESLAFRKDRSSKPFELTIPIQFLNGEHKIPIAATIYHNWDVTLKLSKIEELVTTSSPTNNNNNNPCKDLKLQFVCALSEGVLLNPTDRKNVSTYGNLLPEEKKKRYNKEEEEKEEENLNCKQSDNSNRKTSLQEERYILRDEDDIVCYRKTMTPLSKGPFYEAIKKHLLKCRELDYGTKGVELKRKISKLLQWIEYEKETETFYLIGEDGDFVEPITHFVLRPIIAELKSIKISENDDKSEEHRSPLSCKEETCNPSPGLHFGKHTSIKQMSKMFSESLRPSVAHQIEAIVSHPVTFFLIHAECLTDESLMYSPEIHPFEGIRVLFNGNIVVDYRASEAADFVWKQCGAKSPPKTKKWYLIPVSKQALKGKHAASVNTSRIDRIHFQFHHPNLEGENTWQVTGYAVNENQIKYETGMGSIAFAS